MRICRYDDNRLGVVLGDTIADVSGIRDRLPARRWPYALGDQLVESWEQLRPQIDALLPHAPRIALDEVKLLSPVANPSKIIAIGRSYAAHREEALADPTINYGGQQTSPETIRMLIKANSALVGPSHGVQLRFLDRRNDPELELALVVGRQVSHIEPEHALECIVGYCIGLDMTLRGPESPSHRKSIDSYAVLGPWLVTRDEIAQPQRLAMTLDINGERRQNANTADLLYSLQDIIANASRHYTLYPGDIIMTGTPEGVAPVHPGDTLVAGIAGIGQMTVGIGAYEPMGSAVKEARQP